MVSFVPRGRQVNATRNQTRIKLVSYHRRNQLLILEFTVLLVVTFFTLHIRILKYFSRELYPF